MQEFAEGQDVLISAEVAKSMGYEPWEISIDREKVAKFKEIVDYMAPFEDRSYILTKLARGKDKMGTLDHVWRYVGIRKQFSQTKQKLEDLTKELSHYE